MLESIARAEDIVKVHEARLTEKETTSLSPAEVNEYMATLKVFFKFNGRKCCKSHGRRRAFILFVH